MAVLVAFISASVDLVDDPVTDHNHGPGEPVEDQTIDDEHIDGIHSLIPFR